MENEVVDVRICRAPQELGPAQVYFRPALIYQVYNERGEDPFLITGAHF
jgi:hypothetical protein